MRIGLIGIHPLLLYYSLAKVMVNIVDMHGDAYLVMNWFELF
jgi:hypothetical protein